MIKSALEIALERTKDIEVDKKSIAAREKADAGKRLAGKFLAGDIDAGELKKQLKTADKEELQWLKDGLLSTLSANLSLPQTKEFSEKTALLEEAFSILTGDTKQVSMMFEQINQFFGQYLANQEQLVSSLEQQFAPRLRQKEQEIARQTGSPVKLSPSQDPEFTKVLKDHLGQLESQYSEALKQAKEQLKQLV